MSSEDKQFMEMRIKDPLYGIEPPEWNHPEENTLMNIILHFC